MDYFKQRRAFRKLLTEKLDLSLGQVCLYRELLDYANDEGEMENQFRLRNSVLASRTGLTEDGVKTARNRLVQESLIEYAPGKKNKRQPGYKLVKLYKEYRSQSASSTPDSPATVPQSVPQPVPQTVPHKYLLVPDNDLTSNNNTSRAETSFEQDFEKLWNAYPRRSGKAKAKAAYSQAILAQETTADAIMTKIDEYKAQIKAKNTGPAYIKTGGNWFDEKGWLDDYDTTPEPVTTSRGKRAEPEPDWVKPGYERPKEAVSADTQQQLDEQLAQLRAQREQRQKESEQA